MSSVPSSGSESSAVQLEFCFNYSTIYPVVNAATDQSKGVVMEISQANLVCRMKMEN